MTFFESAILGIVEGATEFLPISSTGHLILASSVLGIPQTEFIKTFEIAIQLGAILAVVAVYWKSFLDTELLKKLLVAFVPTGAIGFLLYDSVKTHLLGNEFVVLGALLLGGFILIGFEHIFGKKEDMLVQAPLTYTQAFLVGLAQTVALIPGVSRSGATIIGGLALGLSRASIVEFSFLLAVPTMLAATSFSILKTDAVLGNDEWLLLAVGFSTAFIVALLSIRWFIRYVQNHSFTAFGVYRILLALAFATFLVI